jgi:hypothetical protein
MFLVSLFTVHCLLFTSSALADGITVNASVKLTAGSVSQQQLSGDVQLTLQSAAPLFAGNAMVLTTNWTAINVGSVGVLGYGWFKNAATNCALQIGVTNAAGVTAFSDMAARNIALLPLATNGVYYAHAVPTVQLNGTNAPTTNVTATLIPYIQDR